MNTLALKETLKTYRYKVDIHTHTAPVSPCSDMSPEALVAHYHEAGCDAVVITNHLAHDLLLYNDSAQNLTYYLADYKAAKALGQEVGLQVLLGLELRFPESPNDYLMYGVDETDVAAILPYLASDYQTFYRTFKKSTNLILQAHPFRNHMTHQLPMYLDGIETYNCHPHHNSRIALATQYAATHPQWIVTAGSDFHHAGHEALGCIRFKTLPTDSFELVNCLKSRDYVFDVSGSIILP